MDCPQTEILEQPGFFDRIKTSGKRIPLSGSLEVTFRCNLRCVHCYLGDNRSGVPGQQEMTKEEIFGILDQVTEAGTLWFLLTGGEPFIRPDFMEIYRYAAHKGLLVTIFTNGTLLTPQLADELAELPPQLVEITLYGATQETYERVTGIPGSYQRCMRGIDLLLERGIPLKLKAMALTANAHEIGAMQAISDKLGLSEFRFDSQIQGAIDGNKTPLSLRLSPEMVVALDMADPVRLTAFKSLYAPRRNKTPSRANMIYRCNAGQTSFHIDPYGLVSVCILSRERTFDLRNGSFQQAWQEFIPQEIAIPAPAENACATCDLLVLCGQCAATANLETGQMDGISKYICSIGQLRAQALELGN